MWPYNLSVRLPVFGLVSSYLTNYLIGHKLLHQRIAPFHLPAYGVLAPVSRSCPPLMDRFLCITHPSATLIPKKLTEVSSSSIPVQLACVKHAASVYPEPGSNSPKINRASDVTPQLHLTSLFWLPSSLFALSWCAAASVPRRTGAMLQLGVVSFNNY